MKIQSKHGGQMQSRLWVHTAKIHSMEMWSFWAKLWCKRGQATQGEGGLLGIPALQSYGKVRNSLMPNKIVD